MRGVHDVLVVALLGLRPLVWDGDPASPSNLLYLGVTVLGVLVAALEATATRTLRWTSGSWAVVALVLVAIPMALRAPVPPEGRAYGMQMVLMAAQAWYLLQVVPARQGLALGGLLGGVAVEIVLGIAQPLVVFPAMVQANQAGVLGPVMGDVSPGDIAERLANGGVYGTFTLSNILGSWLLLVMPVVLWLACSAQVAKSARVAAWAMVLGGLWVFVGTSSKGSWLVAAVVLGCWWTWTRRMWWLPLVGVVGAVAVWQMPAVARGLTASAQVRWEYWQGALRLFAEAPWWGHGWGAFGQRSAEVMPLTAEPTRLVHQSLLEYAVAGGAVMALAAVVVAWGWLRPARPAQPAEDPLPVSHTGWPNGGWMCFAVLVMAYAALLGGFDGNLGWWPGGAGIGVVGWGALLGVVFALPVMLLRHERLPPPWVLRLGVVAWLGHSLMDVDVTSMACLGAVGAMAVLARPSVLVVRGGRALVALPVALFMTVSFVAWTWCATMQRDVTETLPVLSLATQPHETGRQALETLAGGPVPRGQEAAVIERTVEGLLERVGDDYPTRLRLVVYLPTPAQREAAVSELRALLPHHAGLAMVLAETWMSVGRVQDAVAEARRGVALAPASLGLRRRYLALLEQASQRMPMGATAWQDERREGLARLEQLQSVVHPRNR